METFSALLALCAGNSTVTNEFLSQRQVSRSFDVFYLCLTYGWLHNRDAGDLRRHRAHYDVTVMTGIWRFEQKDLDFHSRSKCIPQQVHIIL